MVTHPPHGHQRVSSPSSRPSMEASASCRVRNAFCDSEAFKARSSKASLEVGTEGVGWGPLNSGWKAVGFLSS